MLEKSVRTTDRNSDDLGQLGNGCCDLGQLPLATYSHIENRAYEPTGIHVNNSQVRGYQTHSTSCCIANETKLL